MPHPDDKRPLVLEHQPDVVWTGVDSMLGSLGQPQA